MTNIEGLGPLLLSVPEAARILSLGKTKCYELVAGGELPAIRIGKSVRITTRALQDFVDRLEREQGVTRQD